MSLSALKRKVPWPLKIALKILLARLPAGAGFWRRADVFRHGHMDRPEYALKGFSEHLKRSGLDAGRTRFCLPGAGARRLPVQRPGRQILRRRAHLPDRRRTYR